MPLAIPCFSAYSSPSRLAFYRQDSAINRDGLSTWNSGVAISCAENLGKRLSPGLSRKLELFAKQKSNQLLWGVEDTRASVGNIFNSESGRYEMDNYLFSLTEFVI